MGYPKLNFIAEMYKIKSLILIAFPLLLCSCDFTEYHYKVKLYYLDGSTEITEYDDYSDGCIGCYHGSYSFNARNEYIKGVDRFEILQKTEIKDGR